MAEAIDLLQQVVRDAPTQAEALAGLGAALARTGAPSAAVPYFERALAAGLRTPALLTGLGFARLESGDRLGALAALRDSLALRPDQPGVQQAVRDLSGSLPDPRGRR
jgi:Flp pilus assembly protein TadD